MAHAEGFAELLRDSEDPTHIKHAWPWGWPWNLPWTAGPCPVGMASTDWSCHQNWGCPEQRCRGDRRKHLYRSIPGLCTRMWQCSDRTVKILTVDGNWSCKVRKLESMGVGKKCLFLGNEWDSKKQWTCWVASTVCVLMKWKIPHKGGTASPSLCCQGEKIRRRINGWPARVGTHGMRNVRRLDYNRLDGRDRLWRRKENDITKRDKNQKIRRFVVPSCALEWNPGLWIWRLCYKKIPKTFWQCFSLSVFLL